MRSSVPLFPQLGDGQRRVRLWRKHPGEPSFPARWFLDRATSDQGDVGGALYLRRAGGRTALLCRECGGRDSGRLDLSYAQASALVDGRLVFALMSGSRRLASARLVLDRAHLHKGVQCRGAAPPRQCTRVYTGR